MPGSGIAHCPAGTTLTTHRRNTKYGSATSWRIATPRRRMRPGGDLDADSGMRLVTLKLPHLTQLFAPTTAIAMGASTMFAGSTLQSASCVAVPLFANCGSPSVLMRHLIGPAGRASRRRQATVEGFLLTFRESRQSRHRSNTRPREAVRPVRLRRSYSTPRARRDGRCRESTARSAPTWYQMICRSACSTETPHVGYHCATTWAYPLINRRSMADLPP